MARIEAVFASRQGLRYSTRGFTFSSVYFATILNVINDDIKMTFKRKFSGEEAHKAALRTVPTNSKMPRFMIMQEM